MDQFMRGLVWYELKPNNHLHQLLWYNCYSQNQLQSEYRLCYKNKNASGYKASTPNSCLADTILLQIVYI